MRRAALHLERQRRSYAFADLLLYITKADAAAEAVSLAFPSYSRLVEALRSEGPDCVARVPKKTAKERCVGPAAAARLRSLLTSENPDFVGS